MSFVQENSFEKKTHRNITFLEDSLFNSKLFIDLDSDEDNSMSIDNTEGTENSNEIIDINNDYFLSNELIEELESTCSSFPIEEQEKITLKEPTTSSYSFKKNKFDSDFIYEPININSPSSNSENSCIKSLLPLVNNGYEFLPKNYKPKEITTQKYNKYNSSSTSGSCNSNNNISGKKNKVFQEREGDWICGFCKNLNFSFRTKCNRCKISKQESLKQKIK